MAKKKKQEDPPLGAPLWMATFADMSTLLLAFFIMLLSFSSIQESKFQEAVASLQGALGVMMSPQTVIEQEQVLIPTPTESDIQEVLQEVQKIRISLAEEGLEDQLEISLEKDGIAISIASPFLFEPAKAEMRGDGKKVVDGLGVVLRKVPNRVRVEGHTDNVPIKTDEFPSNWELSSARAIAVLKALRNTGVASDRLSATGFGEFHPVASNANEAGRARNRRVQILVEYREQEVAKATDAPGGVDPAKVTEDSQSGR